MKSYIFLYKYIKKEMEIYKGRIFIIFNQFIFARKIITEPLVP